MQSSVCAEQCVYMCVCCGDINLFTQSHCGDSLPLWEQNSSPHNVNHFSVLTWFKVRLGLGLGK